MIAKAEKPNPLSDLKPLLRLRILLRGVLFMNDSNARRNLTQWCEVLVLGSIRCHDDLVAPRAERPVKMHGGQNGFLKRFCGGASCVSFRGELRIVVE